MSPEQSIGRFSTEQVPEGMRLDYWMNVLGQSLWPVTEWTVPRDFNAELREALLGCLTSIAETPNLLYGQKVQSGSSAGQIYIRGIGQQDTKATFSPGVGIYVDRVYLGPAQANDLDMADV